MRTIAWAAFGLMFLLPSGESLAAQKLINLDVQRHDTPDANKQDLGVDPDFIPGTDPWVGVGPDGVPSLIDFDNTDPVNHMDDQWNFVNLENVKTDDANGDMDGFQDAPIPLNDITGAPSGIGFEFTSPLADLHGGTKSDTSFGVEADDVARDEIHNLPDVIGGTGLTIDWKLSGLDPSGETTYDLYVIAANIWNGGWTELYVTDVNGEQQKNLTNEITVPGEPDDITVKYTGGPLVGLADDGEYKHYADWLGLVPDGNGEISGKINDWLGGTNKKYFSGLQIVVNSASQPGDFDGDGDVDGADFLKWQREDGSAQGLSNWQTNYGASGLLPATSVVPEPGLGILIASLAVCLVGARYPRRLERLAHVPDLSCR